MGINKVYGSSPWGNHCFIVNHVDQSWWLSTAKVSDDPYQPSVNIDLAGADLGIMNKYIKGVLSREFHG